MNYGRVFLGGTCAGPDYRNEFIPLLKCDYFNPVVTDWDEKAQDRAEVLYRELHGYHRDFLIELKSSSDPG